MECVNCNIVKDLTLFYEKHKKCIECVRKNQLCKHDNRKSRCKICKGSSLCEHNVQKYTCSKCEGTSFCIHKIQKTRCKECEGGAICIHNNDRYLCKECDGLGICIHKREKRMCKECKGNRICIHNNQEFNCKKCNGSQICIHKKQIQVCKECKGSQICIHDGRLKKHCIICTPDSKYICISCKLFSVKKNKLCSYCNPNKIIRKKTKENDVKNFLDENNYKYTTNKKCNINSSCKTYFPDFIIDCLTFFLIIECDENAHSSYSIDCEKIRENNICFCLGLPCVFLRFNPDKKNVKMKTKYTILKSYINYYKKLNVCDNISIYLFY